MSDSRPRRGFPLPGMGHVLVLAAAVCGAWLLWSGARGQGWPFHVTPTPAEPADQTRIIDVIDRLPDADVTELIAALSDADAHVRRVALSQLASIGPEAEDALSAIRERLKDERAGVRQAAIIALGHVGQNSTDDISLLSQLLADDSPIAADSAASVLDVIGAPAKDAVMPALGSNSP